MIRHMMKRLGMLRADIEFTRVEGQMSVQLGRIVHTHPIGGSFDAICLAEDIAEALATMGLKDLDGDLEGEAVLRSGEGAQINVRKREEEPIEEVELAVEAA